MNTERPSFYGILPADVRYCSDLSASAKIFYTEITALADQKGFCFASNEYFAALYDVEARQIRRWLSQLSEMGFIKVQLAETGRKIFVGGRTKKTSPPRTKKTGAPGQKRPGGEVKKDLHSSKEYYDKIINDDGAKKNEVKADQNVVTPGPRDRQPFGETVWAESPEKWRLDMLARSADFEPVDLEFYRGRATKWSNSTGAKSADWLEMVGDWIVDDHKKGKLKLKTTNSTQEHETNRPNPSATRNGNIERAIARAERLAHKFGGGGGNE